MSPILEYFAERLNLGFSIFFCLLEFETEKDLHSDPGKNPHAWALQTIQNACLHTSLIALRDLDDFLTQRDCRSRPDDLKAADFGLTQSYGFLTQPERVAINKLIAHSTTHGVQNQRFGWDVFEILAKGVSQSLEFLRWVEKSYPIIPHYNLHTAAVVTRTKTKSIFDCIANEMKKRRAKLPLG